MPVWELLFFLFQVLHDLMIGFKYARRRYFERISTALLINDCFILLIAWKIYFYNISKNELHNRR